MLAKNTNVFAIYPFIWCLHDSIQFVIEVCKSDPNPNPIRSDRIRIEFGLDLINSDRIGSDFIVFNSDRIGSDFIVFYSDRIKLSSFDSDFVSNLLKNPLPIQYKSDHKDTRSI